MLPDSETFRILAKLGLTDLVRDADTRTSRNPKPERHASYLLASDLDAVRRFEIATTPAVSDRGSSRDPARTGHGGGPEAVRRAVVDLPCWRAP